MYNFFSRASIVSVLGIIIVLFPLSLFAQPRVDDSEAYMSRNKKAFEGIIECIQQTHSDTLFYTYHIKGNLVRVDEHDHSRKIDNRLIFDLAQNKITAVSQARKLYMDLPIKPYVSVKSDEFEIIHSSNTKMIHGYKCHQWRVRNKHQNTEIAYWLAADNFEFFEKFLKLWNRSERSAVFFLKLPNIDASFPMLQVERSLLRDEKSRQYVKKITETKIDKSIFDIPEDYKSFDR